jgi:ribose transport system permease protein
LESVVTEKAKQGNGTLKSVLSNNIYVLVGILLVIFITASIFVPAMLQISNIANVLRMASIVGIVAVGATAVLLTGEIDLSVGSIMSLSLVVGGSFVEYGSFTALLITYITGILLGVVNGLFVTKGKITSLMVTLGTLSVFGGLANVVTRGQSIFLYKTPAYLWTGRGHLLGIPFPIVLFIAFTFVFSMLFKYSKFGRDLYYTGANSKASWLSGVEVNKIKIIAYALSGFCAAVAGPLLSSQTNRITPIQGAGYEVSAIAIAVLGGTSLDGGRGKVVGTFLGALTFQFLLNLLTLSGIGTYMEQVLKGILLIAIVMVFQNVNNERRL